MGAIVVVAIHVDGATFVASDPQDGAGVYPFADRVGGMDLIAEQCDCHRLATNLAFEARADARDIESGARGLIAYLLSGRRHVGGSGLEIGLERVHAFLDPRGDDLLEDRREG